MCEVCSRTFQCESDKARQTNREVQYSVPNGSGEEEDWRCIHVYVYQKHSTHKISPLELLPIGASPGKRVAIEWQLYNGRCVCVCVCVSTSAKQEVGGST